MTDVMTSEARSENMRRIRGADTQPELALRRALHSQGLRYRVAPRNLPGRPDIAFTKDRFAVFVHGCFWHRHNCRNAAVPKTNIGFWEKKFELNIARDQRVVDSLLASGWRVCVVWECAIRGSDEQNIKDLARVVSDWRFRQASYMEISSGVEV
ncbi:MAG: DNA mismatch endonuclease Vsr [Candidatus Kapabacteria bacterium]|nr:DNA mismatch endonuclease Vsr [Candidatus Kapabacteria bacterium]